MGPTPQDVPVGFRSCICNTKRTNHMDHWHGIEILVARSRRELLHSDGVLDTHHLLLPSGIACFTFDLGRSIILQRDVLNSRHRPAWRSATMTVKVL